MKHLLLNELVEALQQPTCEVGPYFVLPPGRDGPGVPVKILDQPKKGSIGKPLVFSFHGGIDRAKMQTPMFAGRFFVSEIRGRATVVSVADPSLRLSDTLKCAWYAGDFQCDTPALLGAMFSAMVEELKPSRVLFVGGSVGAHPALLHSRRIPGSIAVVCNPLVRITTYHPPTVQACVEACWPQLGDRPLSSVVTDDVGAEYAGGFSNKVIVLQNTNDHHIHPRVLPFLAQVGNGANILTLVEYFPEFPGHSYPPAHWAHWIRAALDAPDISIPSIAATASRRDAPSAPRSAEKSRSPSPYSNLPQRAFWRPAVTERHPFNIEDLAEPIALSGSDRIATAGSCFAQHIGRHLRLRRANYLDLEPAPSSLSPDEARNHGFGLFSCRYGNVYTARQLLQLVREALAEVVPVDRVWTRNGRFYDAQRPSVSPSGLGSANEVLALRDQHLLRVRELLETVDVFVFTLGLTEAWGADETVFPSAPGTIAGEFDAARYRFHNFRYPEVISDLKAFWSILRNINPAARLILTVSPVPLTATASGQHVLTATVQSKATLRAVAGDLSAAHNDIFYFPSYEIIASHPFRGGFFNPDLRTVNDAGVEYVMQQFFKAARADFSSAPPSTDEPEEPVCDEAELDRYAKIST